VGFLNANPELSERTVLVNGVSKAYAMTGWRIGFAAGPQDVVSAMEAVQSHSTSNACSVAQAAAVAALMGDQSCVRQMRQVFQQRHDRLVQRLNALTGVRCERAGGAFYLFPNVHELITGLHARDVIAEKNDVALCNWLLTTHHLALAAGSWFGAPGHLRCSFAASDEMLSDAINRLRSAVDSL
jgi:aspartate aminotransferase